MEAMAYFKNIHVSPKKLRQILPNIKNLKPQDALDYLLYTPKKGATVLHKAIKSAMYNAKNVLKVGDDVLQFKLLTVEEGNKIKRYRAGSRGTAKPIMRRYSHIKIVITAKEGAVKK